MAAEFGFASLQKFGQEFLKKLHAKKMPNKLLERVSQFWMLNIMKQERTMQMKRMRMKKRASAAAVDWQCLASYLGRRESASELASPVAC